MPIVNSYVYGSLYAAFLAIVLAMVLGVGLQEGNPWRFLTVLLLVAIVATQIDNFRGINRSQVDFHNSAEFIEHDIHRDVPDLKIKVDRQRRLTFGEAVSLWRCWRQTDGSCDVFTRQVSPGGIYLLAEFHEIDEARHATAAAGGQ